MAEPVAYPKSESALSIIGFTMSINLCNIFPAKITIFIPKMEKVNNIINNIINSVLVRLNDLVGCDCVSCSTFGEGLCCSFSIFIINVYYVWTKYYLVNKTNKNNYSF